MNNMLFCTLDQFRSKIALPANTPAISIVRNPNTDKLFADTAKGNYKVEQAIDTKLPIRFMYESEDKLSEGCIVNVTDSDNVIAVL